MRRKLVFQPNTYYHIFNRGVNRQPIFFKTENWVFFLKRLHAYFTPELADIVAYCLMPNHYHLLIYLKTEQFSEKIMHPLMVSYAKAINQQENRVGPLFQGPFKAKAVESDSYLIHLSYYIHTNPVKAGLVPHVADWPYSSYLEYINQRKGTLPHPESILSQFPSPLAYQRFIEEPETQETKLFEKWFQD